MTDGGGAYYAGVMTGTSMDSACAVLCRDGGDGPGEFAIEAHAEEPLPETLKNDLRALGDGGGLASAMDAAADMSRLCAKALSALPQRPLKAVGCHGQTVLHRPARGWTLQLLNGALLAKLCGADVVCDFRSADIAAGGQGAPLTPLFHRRLFAHHAPCAIVNLGGIANITVLDGDDGVRGWDVAPANMLMDAWHRKCCGGDFDRGGAWARSGTPDPALLKRLRADPFLAKPPPKSCGYEQFGLHRFEHMLSERRPEDSQATLLEWCALEVAEAVDKAGAPLLFLCGGGARNDALVDRIKELSAAECNVSDQIMAAEHVEAAAFAWLARQFMHGIPLQTGQVTGAQSPALLGALYPASGRPLCADVSA